MSRKLDATVHIAVEIVGRASHKGLDGRALEPEKGGEFTFKNQKKKVKIVKIII